MVYRSRSSLCSAAGAAASTSSASATANVYHAVFLGGAVTLLNCRMCFVFWCCFFDKLECGAPLPPERRTASQTRYLRRAGPHDSSASSPFPWQLSVVLQRGAGETEEEREKERGRERDSSSPRLLVRFLAKAPSTPAPRWPL